MNGEGSIGLITGIPGSVPGDQREAGMRKGVENTNIKVVGEVAADFDRLKAVGAMEDLLQTHPIWMPSSRPTTRWPSGQ